MNSVTDNPVLLIVILAAWLGVAWAARHFLKNPTMATQIVNLPRESTLFTPRDDDFVDKYYNYDPETEIVMQGKELQSGMVVLIENHHVRADVKRNKAIKSTKTALRNNRWCRVDELYKTNTVTAFVGTYKDGSRMLWREPLNAKWIVKKKSIVKVSS